jgi:RNA polymerase sporulation-specific sigma factor
MKNNEKDHDLQALITAVKEDREGAFEALLGEYQPLVTAEVARYAKGLNRQDQEDLNQYALVALYRAAMSFDPTMLEVTFGLYAKICIKNELVSKLRFLRRHNVEVSQPTEFFGGLAEDPARRVMEAEAVAVLHARIKAALSPLEYRVWSLHYAGYRVGEIAGRLDRPVRSVENAVYRIRQKLRKALGGDA